MCTNSKVKPDHFFFVDSLRLLSCFMVVWHHTLGYLKTAPLSVFYADNIKIYTATVPVFLVVSAFVYAHNLDNKNINYRRYVSNKINRILIPYLSISLVTILLQIFFERTQIITITNLRYTPFVFYDALIDLFFSGAAQHYYFLEIIFAYLIIYPFFVSRFRGKWQPLCLFLVYIGIYETSSTVFTEITNGLDSTIITLASETFWGAKFFLFGFVLYRFLETYWKIFLERGLQYGISLLLAYGILVNNYPELYSFLVYVLILAYLAIAIKLSIRPKRIVLLISSLSYGIYIFHQPYFIKASILVTGFFIPSISSSLRVVSVAILSFVSVILFVYFGQRIYFFNRMFLGVIVPEKAKSRGLIMFLQGCWRKVKQS